MACGPRRSYKYICDLYPTISAMCAAEFSGGAGAAPAKKSGPTPSSGAHGHEEYAYTKLFRSTRMGGVTRPIGVCELCGVVEPVARLGSKTGTHGEWVYRHKHPLAFLILESSNTGRRSYSIEGQPSAWLRQHLEAAGNVWVRYRTHADVYEDIRFHLGEALGEAEDV
jgi:hypothetical protein